MKVKFVLITLVLALMFSVYPGFAQDVEDEEIEMIGPRKGLLGIPDLTADQLKQIEKLRLEHQKDVLPIRTKLQTKRLELRTLILEDKDQKEIEKKVEELGSIRTEMMKKHITHHLAIRNLLTDDQKVFFDARGFGRHWGAGRDFNGRPGLKDFRGPRFQPRHE